MMTFAAEPERRSFDLGNGVTLAADMLGTSDGPTVILLHGGGQTRHAWWATQKRLAEAGYRVISVDQRGHGESSWSTTGAYNLSDYAQDLAELVRQLGDPSPILVGASLGGMASLLAVGEAWVANAASIILVDVVHRPEDQGASDIRSFMLQTTEGFASLEAAADAIAAFLPHRKRPRNLKGLTQNLRQGDDNRWRWHWDPAFMKRPNGEVGMDYDRERLATVVGNITVPVLLLRGGNSEIVSKALAQEFLTLLPSAEHAVIPGARHMISGDNNDEFTTIIREFLERRSRSAKNGGNGDNKNKGGPHRATL